MLIKTKEFVRKLNNRLYQFSFNRKLPLSLKGSFHYTNFISDIDFTSYVYFNEKFIKILIRKIESLKDFKFMYLNAGFNTDFKPPWVIYPEWGCDFDLLKVREWLVDFKTKKLISYDSYDEIYKILTKKKLLMGDLIDVQEILVKYSKIRWFLPDIKKGSKTIGGHTYILLEELKGDHSPVINSVYIDGNDIVSVDIGLVDKRYIQHIWHRMYKYYTENWYKIFKGYKKFISKDYDAEYKQVLSTLEYDNALMAQASLLDSLMKYNVVTQNSINYIAQDLQTRLEKEGIKDKSLKKVISTLHNKLDNKSKPYVDYFLDKLTHAGKIKTYQQLRLTEIAKIPTSTKKLKKRRKNGIECPFFESNIYQHINNISSRLIWDQKTFRKCLEKEKPKDKELSQFVKETFNNSPVSRLFLHSDKSKNFIYVRGSLTNSDFKVLEKFGEKKTGYYQCDIKYTKRLQIYLVTGY
jgi:hypothetical protein